MKIKELSLEKVFKKKIFAKPKKSLERLDAAKAVTKRLSDKARLVTEGETGYFKKEVENEKKSFLSKW